MNAASLHLDELDTPLGPLRLQFDADALHAVTILRGLAPDADPPSGARRNYPHKSAFERYFAGDLRALSELAVTMHGTKFQKSVWKTLCSIPPGATYSYAKLAEQVGNHNATRAVGSANGRNPLCIVVPCHRVIRADGSLGGFSAGLDAKRWLLRHEGANFRA